MALNNQQNPQGPQVSQSQHGQHGQQYDFRSFMNMQNLRAHPVYQWSYHTINHNATLPVLPVTNANALDNNILDYFAHKNWRNYTYPEDMTESLWIESCKYYDPEYHYPQSFYDSITPALRLATLMIRKARPLFVRYVRCPIQQHHGQRRFDPLWVPTVDDYEFLDWCLAHLARNGVILRREPRQDPADKIMGLTSSHFDKCWDHDKTRNPLPVLMGITGDLLDEILDEDLWDAKSDVAKHAVLFELALILLHETSHALFWRRTFWGTQKLFMRGRSHIQCYHTQLWNTNEPSVPFEIQRELGYATNDYLFLTKIGFPLGNFRTAEDRKHGRFHHETRPFYDGSRGHVVMNPNGGPLIELATSTVLSLFDRTTWQADRLSLMLILRSNAPPPGPTGGNQTSVAQNH